MGFWRKEKILETQTKIAIKRSILHIFGLVWTYGPAIDLEELDLNCEIVIDPDFFEIEEDVVSWMGGRGKETKGGLDFFLVERMWAQSSCQKYFVRIYAPYEEIIWIDAEGSHTQDNHRTSQ